MLDPELGEDDDEDCQNQPIFADLKVWMNGSGLSERNRQLAAIDSWICRASLEEVRIKTHEKVRRMRGNEGVLWLSVNASLVIGS